MAGCPPEKFPHARRARPGLPKRMIVVDEVAAGQVPRWLECFRVVGDMAIACPVRTFDGKQPQDDDRHAQRLLEIRHDRLDLGPPRDLDMEWPNDPRARAAVRHHRSHDASHPVSVTARPENPHRNNGRRPWAMSIEPLGIQQS